MDVVGMLRRAPSRKLFFVENIIISNACKPPAARPRLAGVICGG
jgi:hypothetical protein